MQERTKTLWMRELSKYSTRPTKMEVARSILPSGARPVFSRTIYLMSQTSELPSICSTKMVVEPLRLQKSHKFWGIPLAQMREFGSKSSKKSMSMGMARSILRNLDSCLRNCQLMNNLKMLALMAQLPIEQHILLDET